MKSYVFLIILDVLQLVFTCNQLLNITDALYPMCPVELLRRRKREYTRWRANPEITNEFLVKVLDEDLTVPQTKPIVAVNILPATKVAEKIIIGAVNLPSLTTLIPTTGEPREYTRFVQPTTTPFRREGDIFIASMTHTTGKPSLQPQGYYSQRDDSPPASPQFIARTPLLAARQYAPIEPVAFNRRSTIAPLTPPTLTVIRSFTPPTRTHPLPPVNLPIRTEKDFGNFQPFEEEITTPLTYTTLDRSTQNELTNTFHEDEEFQPTANKQFEGPARRFEETKNISEKESSYNSMFYNDDDINGKKEEQEDTDSDYDKKGSGVEALEIDTNELSDGSEIKQNINIEKDVQQDINNYDVLNETNASTIQGVNMHDLMVPTVKIMDGEKLRDKRRPYCSLTKLRQLNFDSPRTLPEIINQLKVWAEDSPVAKWIDITRGNFTTMENPIYMMMVDDPSSGQIVTAKQTVMIIAGIQGRDHHAVTAAMYVLYQLIERTEANTDLLSKYRFWIIPVFNPDGYDYSMTFPNRREWTKNLRQQWDVCKGRDSCAACETHGLRCTIQPCYGVNLDRNFEYQWIPAEELKVEHPCGSLYAGPRQLSEVETRALTRFLHEQRSPLSTFIAFKEGDVLGVMYPYSHTKKKRPLEQVYRTRASRAASAAYSISNRPYVFGQTSEFLPLYAGGIEDWVDGHLGIDNTYTIMMFRPSDSYNTKLMTERVVHETYAAMETLLMQSLEQIGPAPAITLTRAGGSERTLPRRSLCTITVYLILLLYG